MVANGAVLASTLLSSSDVVETHQRQNPTPIVPNAIAVDQAGEWDFGLRAGNAAAATSYSFRVVTMVFGGTPLDAYCHYPALTRETGKFR